VPGKWDAYSAGMHGIWLFLLCVVVLVLLAVVYLAYVSWPKMARKKRIASLLLLAPDFLIIVCIVVSASCGHPPQGSQCFNTQFLCGVLLVFILPLPALVGTLAALGMFIHARFAL
jgi:nucleoside recognition membrane protein YjiH